MNESMHWTSSTSIKKQVELIKKTHIGKKGFKNSTFCQEQALMKEFRHKILVLFLPKINNNQLYLQSLLAKVKINVDKLRLLTQTGNSLNSNLVTLPSYTLMKI